MTDVLWRAFSGYLTDIRSSGSDIRWISDSEGLPAGSRADGTDAPAGMYLTGAASQSPRSGPTLNAVKYEGTYLSS